jgi:hypothetical protein
MTTIRETVRSALRKVGALTRGAEPSSSQARDGLEAFQSLLLEWVDNGKFGRLTNVIASADYEASEQERVVSGGFTITLPDTVVDDDTGETRPPKDLSLVVVVTAGAAPQVNLYDADRGEWVRLDTLEVADDAPLAGRGSDGLASCLAKRLAEEYGPPLGAQSEAAAAQFMSNLTHRRRDSTTAAEYF